MRLVFALLRARTLLAGGVLGVVIVATPAAFADHALCDEAAANASDTTGVPLAVMMAITRVETGRVQDGVRVPWPWALNHSGQGQWFATEMDARHAAERLIAGGERAFDVGCFQLNVRWHADQFSSVADMLNPRLNALYAAQFLTSLQREFGSWERAVAAYHSRNPRFSTPYLARFRQELAGLADMSDEERNLDIDNARRRPGGEDRPTNLLNARVVRSLALSHSATPLRFAARPSLFEAR